MAMQEILLVEDDRSIVTNLSEFLHSEGFSVTSAAGQQRAVELAEQRNFDLALVDVSLADGNGFAVCSAIKARGGTPVIFLTASGDEYSTVTGFEIGADDYIAKPFRPKELVSRIKNVLRRSARSGQCIEIGSLHIDTDKGTAERDGTDLFLSALEYRLLLVFVNNRGRVMSRNQLLEEIWDIAGEFVNDNTLTVYIKRLREKIEADPQNPEIIKTVRGIGYRMD